jgi:hypothetical protein
MHGANASLGIELDIPHVVRNVSDLLPRAAFLQKLPIESGVELVRIRALLREQTAVASELERRE